MVSLGVRTPTGLDFRLAFLMNALALDGIVSELALDGAFFGHLDRAPVEASERALEKMRFARGKGTPLADPAAELRKLIEAELVDLASDTVSEASLDGLSNSGSTPRSVVKPPALLRASSAERLSESNLIENCSSPSEPEAPDSAPRQPPSSAGNPNLKADLATFFPGEAKSLQTSAKTLQTPAKPLQLKPYNPLQLNPSTALQRNPSKHLLSSPSETLQPNPEPLPQASRLVPVR